MKMVIKGRFIYFRINCLSFATTTINKLKKMEKLYEIAPKVAHSKIDELKNT